MGGADPGRKEGPRLGKAGDGHAVGRDGEKWVGGEYSLEEGAAHFPDGRDVGRRERSADGVTKLLGLSQCGGPPLGDWKVRERSRSGGAGSSILDMAGLRWSVCSLGLPW